MVELSRKFKAPKKNNLEEWRVIEILVKAGFTYQTIYIGNGQLAEYPRKVKDTEAFIKAYQNKTC